MHSVNVLGGDVVVGAARLAALGQGRGELQGRCGQLVCATPKHCQVSAPQQVRVISQVKQGGEVILAGRGVLDDLMACDTQHTPVSVQTQTTALVIYVIHDAHIKPAPLVHVPFFAMSSTQEGGVRTHDVGARLCRGQVLA